METDSKLREPIRLSLTKQFLFIKIIVVNKSCCFCSVPTPLAVVISQEYLTPSFLGN